MLAFSEWMKKIIFLSCLLEKIPRSTSLKKILYFDLVLRWGHDLSVTCLACMQYQRVRPKIILSLNSRSLFSWQALRVTWHHIYMYMDDIGWCDIQIYESIEFIFFSLAWLTWSQYVYFDFRRQNLTSTDVISWRLKSIPALWGLIC